MTLVFGQSNEQGSGGMPDANTYLGAPLRDPVAPMGQTMRSMWPRLAGRLATRGIWLDVQNTAVGGAGACPTWAGFVRQWASGIFVPWGSYVRSADGGLWRANLTPGVAASSTTQPSGTSNVTLDTIPWVYVGVATAADADRSVYAYGSPRFDPAGYVAQMYGYAQAASLVYDEVWLIVSIGQGDRSVGAVRSEYAAALKNVIDRMLPVVSKVFVGMTCYAATAGSDQWYTDHLLPGRLDVLEALKGNPKVFPGANLRESLGVLPVTPASQFTPGLKSDQLHMDNAAYALASDAWYDNLISVGAA